MIQKYRMCLTTWLRGYRGGIMKNQLWYGTGNEGVNKRMEKECGKRISENLKKIEVFRKNQ